VRAALVVAVSVVLGALAAQQPPAPAPRDPQAAERLRAHLAFLADDLLDGRFTGTPQYEIAARYVASQLRQLGLEPVGGGSYLLPVPLVAGSIDIDSAVFEVVAHGKRQPLEWGEGCVAEGDTLRDVSEVEAPVVFVGYGVTAPELGWDDYAGLDVRGKLVLVMRGAPAAFPHDQRAYHGASETKKRQAAAHGAIGYLSFRTKEDAEKSPWERWARNAGRRPSMAWREPDGSPHNALPALQAYATLSDTGIVTMLAAAGRGFESTVPAMSAAGKGFELGVAARVSYRSKRHELSSSNVAALLPGADPALAGEVVVFTAHLDHVGPGAAVGGDSVYNGFYDNAMGSALLLETARAFAIARDRPRRTLLFLAVTGEERGLLGSQHFAFHPPPGIGRMVADVNLDMPLFLYPVADVVAFGAEHSSLEGPAERAAKAAGFALSPDPIPDEVIFVRSDQYSFVERGIPAVYFMPGFGSLDPQVDGGAAFRGFLAEHYHQPSDETTLPVDWPSALRFLQANVVLARAIADDDAAPAWKAGDFFGTKFGALAPTAATAMPRPRRLQR
jgi:Zn-dependent M28 family amino/carboxypeptidase